MALRFEGAEGHAPGVEGLVALVGFPLRGFGRPFPAAALLPWFEDDGFGRVWLGGIGLLIHAVSLLCLIG